MKKFKRMVCILLTMLLCFAGTVPAAAVTANYTRASKAYKAWLKKMTSGQYNSLEYDIVDLDGNGIPELMASGYSKEGPYSYVYTYDAKKGKMVRLKKLGLGRIMGSGITYKKSKKMFIIMSSDTARSRIWFYKVKGTKITKAAVYEFRSLTQYPKGPNYLINNKKCSQSTYTKKIKNAQKGFRSLRYTTA
ncbi:MAG: hypothetical protein Q4C59_12480 [Lachnospiraceae bacterium]|nr:hypothetical protein [Lachnospiraceae bacterium]